MNTQYPQDPWLGGGVPPSAPPHQPASGPPAGPLAPPYATAAVPPAPPTRLPWWKQIPLLAQLALIGGAAVLLFCGGLATFGAIVGALKPANDGARVAPVSTRSTTGSAGSTLAPGSQSSHTATPTLAIETKTVTETQTIPYATASVNDPNLAKGTTTVRTKGVAGVKTLTYEVRYTNGVATNRKLVREVVTKAPVTQVIAVGTKETPRCDPNYSGACVPIASDVDCAGGSGDGPAYVKGPVRVIGKDIYGLDHDRDGIGCE